MSAAPGIRGRFSADIAGRRRRSARFRWLCAALSWAGVAALVLVVGRVALQGVPHLSASFLTSFPSRFPDRAGVKSALAGTLWVVGLTAGFSIPVGVAAAVYLEEYAGDKRWARWMDLNIANLAGVPSIVYGILGLAVFVRWWGLGRSVLAGAATLSLVILPMVIIAAREAVRAVPASLRQASYGLGATRWQTVWHHVLPAAVPGITTGIILAVSRAIGATAPLLVLGALTFVAFVPAGPGDAFTALPIQIFNWASRPKADFHALAAAGILVLLGILAVFNSIALVIRLRCDRSS